MSYLRITKQERKSIEQMLKQNISIHQIAIALGRCSSSIIREIHRNRVQSYFGFKFNKKHADNNCLHATQCEKHHLCVDCDATANACRYCARCNGICDLFEAVSCSRRNQSPGCCNGCAQTNLCHLVKYLYRADHAQKQTDRIRKESRSGIAMTEDEIFFIDNLVSPLLKKGQSLHHIYLNHSAEIPCSEKTLYVLLHAGTFNATLFDSPRIVQRKQTRTRPEKKVDKQCYLRRTHRDFQHWLELNPGASVVEMDTVEGPKGSSKVLLTFKWRHSGFLLAFLLPRKTSAEVSKVFRFLQNLLGMKRFQMLFPVILTDRGTEFSDPLRMEFVQEERWTWVFYCDAQKPQQKPYVENEHSLLRRKLPKKYNFENLEQEDIQYILSHVNSYKRSSKEGKSPIELFRFTYGEDVLSRLQIQEIAADDVDLTVYRKA